MTLDVCLDQALRSWILSFGSVARVISPTFLVADDRTRAGECVGKYE